MNYKIKPIVWSVKSKESVKFHVENDDYFATIATILHLIKKEIKDNENREELNNILNNIEKDLLFLQNNYQIKPKIKKRKIMPKGKEINQ